MTRLKPRKWPKPLSSNKNNKLIVATASTVGLPDLRSGCAVEILGFGVQTDKKGNPQGSSSDFDGEYFVTDSTHTIGGSGYRTEFTARRDGPVTQRQTLNQG